MSTPGFASDGNFNRSKTVVVLCSEPIENNQKGSINWPRVETSGGASRGNPSLGMQYKQLHQDHADRNRSRYCPIELAVAENTLFALPPINRIVPTTKTKITASITVERCNERTVILDFCTDDVRRSNCGSNKECTRDNY